MSSTPSTGVRIAAGVIAAALALLAALAVDAAPAAGHEGEGELTLQLTDPAAPNEPGPVRYQVLLAFLNDGHPAPDATVTVVAERSGVPPVGPLAMSEGATEGSYEATVRFPSAGAWTVRFTAVTPTALLELTQDLAPAPTTVAVPTTSPATSAPTIAPATTVTPVTATSATSAAGGSDGGDGSGAWLPVVLAIAFAAAAIVGAAALVRHRRAGPPTLPTAGPE